MNQRLIKFGVFYCLLLVGSITSFAQIDNNNKGAKTTLEIPPEIESQMSAPDEGIDDLPF